MYSNVFSICWCTFPSLIFPARGIRYSNLLLFCAQKCPPLVVIEVTVHSQQGSFLASFFSFFSSPSYYSFPFHLLSKIIDILFAFSKTFSILDLEFIYSSLHHGLATLQRRNIIVSIEHMIEIASI